MRREDQDLIRLIRDALPPADEPRPCFDLWPRLEQRLENSRPRPGKLDWLLAALAFVLLAVFPEIFLLVAYHL